MTTVLPIHQSLFPPIILASKSPRRQELLNLMDLPFQVVLREVDESYPDDLEPDDVALYIAEKKARAFDYDSADALVITADTVVVLGDTILGKPADEAEALTMLRSLSGNEHRVITGVCLRYKKQLVKFYDTTTVFFRTLSDSEIQYYVKKYKPMDKAGAYGIQEWIGVIGIEKIVGSYSNVVGLPVEKLYAQLLQLSSSSASTPSFNE